MQELYLERKLETENDGTVRVLSDKELSELGFPLVILGDPGIGKTKLTDELAKRYKTCSLSAGRFVRASDPRRLLPKGADVYIIDGIDELAASTGSAAVDSVLTKLSALGLPKFVISCRAADWNGSADRKKIEDDYNVAPKVARLLPFDRAQAKGVLEANTDLDPDKILDTLDERSLSGFYENPLTLNLLIEVIGSGGGLPTDKGDLLKKATEVLAVEKNPAHSRSPAAMTSSERLLHSGGAAFASVIMTGATGIADRAESDTPDDFVSVAKIDNLPAADKIQESLRTRLFQGVGENLFKPYHRVIAEYLAAKWLAHRIANGLSARRIHKALLFENGVPSSLRGLHAWLGYFSPALTDAVIEADPYGMLRYGDSAHFTVPQSKRLLKALGNLAAEDPYFRSEDWGNHAVSTLARVELEPEILELLKSSNRHVHLTSLLLEQLPGTELAKRIAPELERILLDAESDYIERFNAGLALIAAQTPTEWENLLDEIREVESPDNLRLELELIGRIGADTVHPAKIASALMRYHGVTKKGGKSPKTLGSDYKITRDISGSKSRDVLDEIAAHISGLDVDRYWRVGHTMAWAIQRLMAKAINAAPSAHQLWSWLRVLEHERGLHDRESNTVKEFLEAHPELRREVQRLAIYDFEEDEGPFTSILFNLPRVGVGLEFNETDAIYFLSEFTQLASLTEKQKDLWLGIIRSQGEADKFSSKLKDAILATVKSHPGLAQEWDAIENPKKPAWQVRDEQRQKAYAKAQAVRFDNDRKIVEEYLPRIQAGEPNTLYSIAQAYRGLHSELGHDLAPNVRVEEWLGPELASKAFVGFEASLWRNDLPTVEAVGKSHATNRHFNAEWVLVVAVSERVRKGQTLNDLSIDTILTTLATWWDYADLAWAELGEKVGVELETAAFAKKENIDRFLRAVIEPQLGSTDNHIRGLYRFTKEPRFAEASKTLILDWLSEYPDAQPTVVQDLLTLAFQLGYQDGIAGLAEVRLADANLSAHEEIIWLSASLVTNFAASVSRLAPMLAKTPTAIWTIRSLLSGDENVAYDTLSPIQREFLIANLSQHWPPAPPPSGTWSGDSNPWDASDFIKGLISTLAASKTAEASDALDRLQSETKKESYQDFIKHKRAQQLKARRDSEFVTPTIEELIPTLIGGQPKGIDDLKALVLDEFDWIQKYLRDGDTRAWKAFWGSEGPLVEESCRDRLLDLLRGRLPIPIRALPETLMPDLKRADIVIFSGDVGLPIEVKGQWNKHLWTAPSDQLIDLYTKDFRAGSRGIYVALWFGPQSPKKLKSPPAGIPIPTTPEGLRDALKKLLSPSQASKIDIYVFDLSPTDRKSVIENIRKKGKDKAKPGPGAARSQDFLFDDESSSE